jgi:hypothetical protein
VVHGVGDRGRNGDGGQLAEAFCSQRTCFLVELADEERLELRDVRAGRNKVAGEVPVKDPAQSGVSLGLFEEGLSDTPDDAADCLATGGLGVDDLAGVVGSDEAVEPDEA